MSESWLWLVLAIHVAFWAATCRGLKLAQPVQLELQANGQSEEAQILPAQFGDMPYGRLLRCVPRLLRCKLSTVGSGFRFPNSMSAACRRERLLAYFDHIVAGSAATLLSRARWQGALSGALGSCAERWRADPRAAAACRTRALLCRLECTRTLSAYGLKPSSTGAQTSKLRTWAQAE